MNPLAALLTLTAAGLTGLVTLELLPGRDTPEAVAAPRQRAAEPAAAPATLDADPAASVATLLARPLFSQARRPPDAASPAAAPGTAATPLPRMTGILIDGSRRSAIFAATDGKAIVVAEGGSIGPFTVQTIEPQQVIVSGPEGRRTVHTSFDTTLPPPAPLPPIGLGAPQFPGIIPGIPGGPPQLAGAAR